MNDSDKSLKDKISNFGQDTTKRLYFRDSDLLIHLRFKSIFHELPYIIDFWEMGNGQYATITNIIEDFPTWFRLHPTEVCNYLAYKMLDKFNKGDYPSEPIEGPNIWRIRAGDSIVWLGDSRTDIESYQGILGIFKFSECALLIGEPILNNLKEFLSFGSLNNTKVNEVSLRQIQEAIYSIKELIIPRSYAMDWMLG